MLDTGDTVLFGEEVGGETGEALLGVTGITIGEGTCSALDAVKVVTGLAFSALRGGSARFAEGYVSNAEDTLGIL